MIDVSLPELAWLPSPNQSSRAGVEPNLIVVHETAGPYMGAVAWLLNPRAQASAHLVLREDGRDCAQLVELGRKAWTQCAFNPRAVSLELANVTAKGYATDHQLHVAARIVGWLALLLGVPPRWSRAGSEPGVTRHADLGAAGCGHTQCGPDLDGWHWFLELLHAEIARGEYRSDWARV